MEVDFLDAVNGTKTQLRLSDGPAIEVQIPAGTRDGQTLRLRGKGEPGIGGAPAGDALIDIHVRPHRFFTRDGDDIRLDLPISLGEAVLGGKIRVPTPSGPVSLTVPPNSNTGNVLRLKGKGVAKRDGGNGDDRDAGDGVFDFLAHAGAPGGSGGLENDRCVGPRRYRSGRPTAFSSAANDRW